MELLKKLTEIDAPSGREHEVRAFITEEAKKLGYEVSTDALGSVIAHKKGNGKKLMLAAHIDEVGAIVSYIEDNGFVRFGTTGGLRKKELNKHRVRFANGTLGVIGIEKEAFEQKPDFNKMYIDIGAANREEAENLVTVGDTAVFDSKFSVSGDTVISKALDDRVGCYILLEAMAQVKDCKNDLYFVFTVQEEAGMRGGKTSAFTVMPDYAIVVDATTAFDTPGSEASDVKLGSGVAINNKDNFIICDRDIVNTLRGLAEKNSIPYTNNVNSIGGNDSGAIVLTGGGVKTGGISVPLRNMHSASEVVRKSDIDACKNLLIAICQHEW